jgi:uncharacterized protein YdaU (DUF1376 family)
MADFPALPFWTDAYLADTRHLTTLEHGAYFLLMMEAWRRPTCSLPDDDRMLARLAGLSLDEWEEVKIVVMSFWKLDGRSKSWSQKRLSKERGFVKKKSQSQADKAASRWNKSKKDHAAALPEGCRDVCPGDAPTPTPTPTPFNSPSDSSISEDDPNLDDPPALLPAVADAPDDAQTAFDRHDAVRREFVPNARSVVFSPDRRKKLATRLNEIGA